MGALEVPWNQALAKIPGIAQKFPPKYDAFGKAIERYQYGASIWNVFLSPWTVKYMAESPAIREANRLYAATQDPRVAANRVNHYVSETTTAQDKTGFQLPVSGKVELTNEQISRYAEIQGRITLELLDRT